MGIFTKSQERVLALIFGDVDESFTVTDLIKAAKCGSGAVQREVAKLAAEGLITMTPVGNQKRYQANRDAPIFEELRRIVMKSGRAGGSPAGPPPSRRPVEPDSDFVD